MPRKTIAFVVLFVLYQSAEGIGDRWLHSFAVQAALMTACVAAAWPLSRWLGYRGYQAWALVGPWRRAAAWLAGGLALAFAAKAAALCLGSYAGVYAPADAAASTTHVLLAALPMLLVSTFVPSIAEDILTRGFWYRASGIAWRRGIAFVAFSSLLYLLNHIYRLDHGPLAWMELACYGIAYATALWRSGTLWAAVGLHWGWNLANGVLDHLMPLDVVDPSAAYLSSSMAHLAIAAIVLALPAAGAKPRT